MKFTKASIFIGILISIVIAAPHPILQDSFSDVELPGPRTSDFDPPALQNKKKFVIVLKESVDAIQLRKHTIWASELHARYLKKRQDLGLPVEVEVAGVERTFDINRFKAYAGSFDRDTLEEIERSDDVAYIEPEQDVYTADVVTQESAPWGLADISNQASNTTNYHYDSSAGEGMYAYIVDSGINFAHEDFEGRAELGYNALKTLNNTDTSGHGTHVSGIVAGKTYGVAKKARLVNVKVFSGSKTSTITVIEGFNWAVQDIIAKNRTGISVINMSLTTNVSKAFNTAVDSAYEKGVVTVVAAGNSNLPASMKSPASATNALTVGGVSLGHVRGSYSNYGSAVKIMAPGTKILSVGIANSTAFATKTGTSMAAPHVAGLVCYLKKLEGLRTAKETIDRVLGLAQRGVLNETTLMESPNLLAYNGIGL
ncbi:hypothetical protein H072_11364 [Dactylellina haptotyla CBS 200.50]|uniref:Peptidase S8/S53 domain-containing protein n=1 Tax=Dactylellina haptotyla (strain CBS 200.50) TaxID=1284197 RepID=S8BJ01_DACHA|nr:hypothetical protein H072_11364 [Dactylellina haptotyla CBS 200.50]